ARLTSKEKPAGFSIGGDVVGIGAGLSRKSDQFAGRGFEELRQRAVYSEPSPVQSDEADPDPNLFDAAVQLLLGVPAPQLCLTTIGNLLAQLDLGNGRSCKVLQ